MRGLRNLHKATPTAEDCEPGCQGCAWEGTCDGPPDLCPRCGLAVPSSGFITDDQPMCSCPRDTPWWPWAPRRRLALWPQQAHIYQDWRDVDAYRASGDMTCETCGLLYYDHPNLPGAEELCPTLMLLCRGDVVKV